MLLMSVAEEQDHGGVIYRDAVGDAGVVLQLLCLFVGFLELVWVLLFALTTELLFSEANRKYGPQEC
jgi:hypothetical protein